MAADDPSVFKITEKAPNSNSVLNVKAVLGDFNQEKALVGAFSVIVQLRRLIVCSTNLNNVIPGLFDVCCLLMNS